MKYRMITVANLGYANPDSASPDVSPVEIFGLDNHDDQRFVHLGYDYPADLDAVTIHKRIERADATGDLLCLVAYEGDDLTVGADVTDPVAILVSVFGWSEGASLDADGLPINAD